MLIESATYTAQSSLRDIGEDYVFRYCEFENASLDELAIVTIEGVFIGCTFTNVEMYWTLLTNAIFIDCTFVNCAFRGASFASCRVVDCTFTTCAFMEDNLGSACRFDETVWYGSTQNGCTGLSEALVPLGV